MLTAGAPWQHLLDPGRPERVLTTSCVSDWQEAGWAALVLGFGANDTNPIVCISRCTRLRSR